VSDLDKRRDELLKLCDELGIDASHIVEGSLCINMDKDKGWLTWEGYLPVSLEVAQRLLWDELQ
jgi:hypothetical protein